MATWREIGQDNYRSALFLLDDVKDYRSATSRFYYAAFSLLTHELAVRHAEADFRDGRETPGHAQLPSLIEKHFTHYSEQKARNLIGYVRNLYRARLSADYSLQRVDKAAAFAAHRAAQKIFDYLEVDYDTRK